MSVEWLDGLNTAQRAAVTYGEGPLLVVAGAGTGKTKTLACRVAYLIDQGVAPDRILLLTFTRRAAAEMLRRAGQITGLEAAGKVWGGTFHAVGSRLLRTYGRAIDVPDDFTVMDQSDAADLMNLIRGELGLAAKSRRFPRKQTLVAIYSRTVNAREKLGDVLRVRFPWCRTEQADLQAVFERYVRRKREQNLLDYDDLLLYWQALCTAPGIGDTVADRFAHVLVDEFQDTNAVQADILRGLRRTVRNIMVVGDDAQSIYSFRAATIRNILDFPEQFPGTRTVTLEQNYRSVQTILDASNAVMAQAGERYTKNLWSERRSDQKPILVHCEDESAQCTAVCENILAHREGGTPLMKQAVLFRAGHHSAQLEIELTRRNIPFHKFGGLRFVEAAHIKDMLAFLRILENPYDQISWYRMLQMLDGIGPKRARLIMESLGVRAAEPGGRDSRRRRGRRAIDGPATRPARDRAASPLARLARCAPEVPAAAREVFERLRSVLAECDGRRLGDDSEGGGEAAVEPLPLTTQIERLRLFYEPIFEATYDNARMRLRDLEQLEQIASTYRSRSRFITDLTLDPPASTSDLAAAPHLDDDYLILSTIHSAKGCEWDVVSILHAADGMIPSDMAVGDQAGIDEERRLFYVAMTRAKNWLYVYFPLRYYHRRYNLGDQHGYAQLTRFVSGPVRALMEDRAVGGDLVAYPPGGSGVDARLSELWRE